MRRELIFFLLMAGCLAGCRPRAASLRPPPEAAANRGVEQPAVFKADPAKPATPAPPSPALVARAKVAAAPSTNADGLFLEHDLLIKSNWWAGGVGTSNSPAHAEVVLIGFAPDSLAFHACQSVSNLLRGKTPGRVQEMIERVEGPNGAPVGWNTNNLLWNVTNMESHPVMRFGVSNGITNAYDYNWSFARPTPLTRRHVVMVEHMTGGPLTNLPGVNASNFTGAIWLDRGDNRIYRRCLDAYSTNHLTVFLLDSDLPASIPIPKVLTAADLTNHLPSMVTARTAPLRPLLLAVTPQNYRRVAVVGITWARNDDTLTGLAVTPSAGLWFDAWSTIDNKGVLYHGGAFGGDSGTPVWLVINNELVYLGAWMLQYSLTPAAPSIEALNGAIKLLNLRNGVVGDYHVTTYDLGRFAAY